MATGSGGSHSPRTESVARLRSIGPPIPFSVSLPSASPATWWGRPRTRGFPLPCKTKSCWREMAVRLALGAGRARILRQLSTESVLLAIIAGAAGMALAALGTRTLGKMHPMATGLDLHPDARVLTFTGALCLLTAVLFGLAP